MRKLVKGIVDFRRTALPEYRQKFSQLASGQSPDSLFVACSDSRVVPNLFASTDPGDLFVVRNVGNLVPRCGLNGHSTADESEAAAIEFAVMNLSVSDIIVCGHSDCGAMHALVNGREKVLAPNLRAWLRHGEPSLERLPPSTNPAARVNTLSKMNVLHQLENLRSYPIVRGRMDDHKLKLHAWWFDLGTAEVYAFDEDTGRYFLIDEAGAERILSRL